MPDVAEPASQATGRTERMDASIDQFLYGGRLIGYLAALAVFVVSVAFGVLIVRPWERGPADSSPR
jgi:hypothetical protein